MDYTGYKKRDYTGYKKRDYTGYKKSFKMSDELEEAIIVMMLALPIILMPVIYGIAHSFS